MQQKNTIKQILYILIISVLSLTVLSSFCKKKNKAPNTPSKPAGATATFTNKGESYTTDATDPDGNLSGYIWSMNDTQTDTTAEGAMTYSWSTAGNYTIKVKAYDDKNLESGWSEVLTVAVEYNAPPTMGAVTGPSIGMVNQYLNFSATATDPTSDSVQVRFIYKKKNTTTYTKNNWSIFKASGSSFTDSIKFTTGDTYVIRATAKDKKGSESDTAAAFTMVFWAPRIDPITGPSVGWLGQGIDFSTIARDTVDSVYVRFIYKKKSVTSYTAMNWIGPKRSGSTFTQAITFTAMDSFVIRAVAKNKQNTFSDTTPALNLYVNGWAFGLDIPFQGTPALFDVGSEEIIAIGAGDGGDSYFYFIKAADGSQKWQKRSIGEPAVIPFEPEDVFYTSPAVNATGFSAPRCYLGGESGEFYCYEAGSGYQYKWRFPDSSYDGMTWNEISASAAVAASGNRVFIPMNTVDRDSWRMFAIQDNGESWTKAWEYYIGNEVKSSPAIDASGNIYFGDDSGYVTRLNSNGVKTWRRRISTGVYNVYASPTIGSDGIYIGTDDGYMFKLDAATGNQIWKYPTTIALEGVRSSVVIGTSGNVYFGCDDGKLYVLSSAGALVDSVTLSDGAITSTPALANDGTIIVTTEEDYVYVLNPDLSIKRQIPLIGAGDKQLRIKPKARSKYSRLLEDIIPSPIIGSDGTIYVASVNGGLYAIKGETSPSSTSVWPKFRHDLKNTGRYGATK